VSASALLKSLTEFRLASSLTVIVPYRIASAFMGFPRDPDACLRRFMFGPSAYARFAVTRDTLAV
jgi:hypothetical protein